MIRTKPLHPLNQASLNELERAAQAPAAPGHVTRCQREPAVRMRAQGAGGWAVPASGTCRVLAAVHEGTRPWEGLKAFSTPAAADASLFIVIILVV